MLLGPYALHLGQYQGFLPWKGGSDGLLNERLELVHNGLIASGRRDKRNGFVQEPDLRDQHQPENLHSINRAALLALSTPPPLPLPLGLVGFAQVIGQSKQEALLLDHRTVLIDAVDHLMCGSEGIRIAPDLNAGDFLCERDFEHCECTLPIKG